MIKAEYSEDRTILIEVREMEGHFSIPSGVKEIGSMAFWNCTSVTSVEIPDTVTRIGRRAFWNCASLTKIVISSSVDYIGDEAFEGCDNLREVHIRTKNPDDVSIYASTEVEEMQKLISCCTIYVPEGSVEAYRRHPVFSKFKAILPE